MVIDASKTIDYYALPNTMKLLRQSKFAWLDEIMAVPLLTFQEVFNL